MYTRIMVLALLLLASLLLLACSSSSTASPSDLTPTGNAEFDEHLANARDYRAEGEYSLALVEVRQALAVSPRSATAQQLQREIEKEATPAARTAIAQATAAGRLGRSEATAAAREESAAQAAANRTATAAARAVAPAATTGRAIPPGAAVGSAPCQPGQIKGNRTSHIFHLPSQRDYERTKDNVTCFNTEAEAQAAGFRRAER